MNNKIKLAYATSIQAIRKAELEDEVNHLALTAKNAFDKGMDSLANKLLAKRDRLIAKLAETN